MPYFVFIPYAALLVIYLVFEQKKNFVTATTLKLCLAAVFCVTSWMAVITSAGTAAGSQVPSVMISTGLIFAFAGDYFLQYIKLDRKKFKTGIICFAATQVFLITAYYMISPVSHIEFVIFAAFLALAFVLMRFQKWDVSEQSPQILIYTLLIAFMGAKALSFAFTAPHLVFLAVGGMLFFVSDMILGIWNYSSGKMYLAHLNWITYFSGEILIAFGAWSLVTGM